jgi:Domain of unknown function (DUF4124)
MSLTRWLGVALLVAGIGGPAMADILVWRDKSGVSHYTNDIANVPPEYRAEAMTVAKDWARAQPAPEPAPVAATVATDNPAGAAAHESYESAYRAGFRAGEQGEPAASPAGSVGSVVQNVEVQPQSGVVADRLVPVPVIVERHRSRGSRRDEDRDQDEARDRLPPAQRAPFLQGPAGPPPISER